MIFYWWCSQVSAHTHTHLHMHPDAAAAAMLLAQPPGFPGNYNCNLSPLGQNITLSGLPGYRPPGPFDLGAGIRPPPGADYLARLMQHPSGLPGAPPPPHVS